MSKAEFDLFIIGGGINGCGVARDAAGRGYKVFLSEMNDLASGTSSGSSKLIHGGLRYLEHYEFGLVRKALSEREVLWSLAPHLIHPLRFVLPHHKGLRPAWLLRLGLFLYDYIGARKLLPPTKTLDLSKAHEGKPLKGTYNKGFEYSDCWVDDARLVVLNAADAEHKGAEIKTRTKCISARYEDDIWHLKVEDTLTGVKQHISARMIINASGPWVDDVLENSFGRKDQNNVRQVQGSHIVVPKLYDHERAYIFQNKDERIVFAIPYLGKYTVIGTTDRDFKENLSRVKISDKETTYLCELAGEYFNKPINKTDIVWDYSGVRPLYDDGASSAKEATRDFVLKPNSVAGEPPLINIFGGKITTYRKLAEVVMDEVEERIGRKGRPWTSKAALPGGNFETTGFDRLLAKLKTDYPFLENNNADRLARNYGTQAWMVLAIAKNFGELGVDFGHGLSEAEVRYLAVNEWAKTSDDILWRRTKLGLEFTKGQVKALSDWMKKEL